MKNCNFFGNRGLFRFTFTSIYFEKCNLPLTINNYILNNIHIIIKKKTIIIIMIGHFSDMEKDRDDRWNSVFISSIDGYNELYITNSLFENINVTSPYSLIDSQLFKIK